MSIRIGIYSFEGPFQFTTNLEDRSGVYVILCRGATNYALVDVGESSTVRNRVETHDRRDCWLNQCQATSVAYAVRYTPGLRQAGRKKIEQDIRSQYRVPCGER